MLESKNKMLKAHFNIHRSFATFKKKLLVFQKLEEREFSRLMKYGDNAYRTRRMVSAFKDGKLADLKLHMDNISTIDDMEIFRFLRRAAIVNCISKPKYQEWVELRLAEEVEDASNWKVNPQPIYILFIKC